MSHSRNSGSLLQREREREKKRREQQAMKSEPVVDEPIFSEPKKVYTSRQDSLTRNIHNTLGDSQAVSGILFQKPNLWLGTSRSEQGPPTPAPTQQHTDAPVYPSDRIRKDLAQKRDQSGSAHNHIQSSKQQLSSGQISREDSLNRSKHSQSYHKSRRNQSGFSSQTNDRTASFNSTHPPINNRDSMLTDNDKTPSRISERDRVSSVDSDIFGGVETIFKEMVDCPPTLTEIKTPNVSENKFNFTGSKRRLATVDSNIPVSAADGKVTSDIDSSGDESSEDEEEEVGKWNLRSLAEETQSFNPLLSSNNSNFDDSAKRKLNTSSHGRKLQPETKSPRHQDNLVAKDSGSNQVRGRKLEKKQSSSGSSNKSRSSSSSQRSTSGGHKSMSYEKRSASLQRTALPNDGSHTKMNSDETEAERTSSHREDSAFKQKRSSSKQMSGRRGSGSVPPHSPVKSSGGYRGSPSKMTSGRNIQPDPLHHEKESKNSSGKISRVSKETISSTTATNAKAWPSVGRKGPSSGSGHSTPVGSNSSSKVVADDFSDSDVDMSDDEKDVVAPNNIAENDSDSDANMSSDSNSDTSSDSESNSEDENTDDENQEKNAWSLSGMRASEDQNPVVDETSIKNESKSTSHITHPHVRRKSSDGRPAHSPIAPSAGSDSKSSKVHGNLNKLGRKSSSGSLTPSQKLSDSNISKTSSKLYNSTNKHENSAIHTNTVDSTNRKSSNTRKVVDTKQRQQDAQNRINPHLNHTIEKPELNEHHPMQHTDSVFSGLWVRIKSSLLSPHLPSSLPNTGNTTMRPKLKSSNKNSSFTIPSKTASPENSSVLPQKRNFTTVSTGSETEQPIRRANSVQYAVADSYLADNVSSFKRKHNASDQNYEEDLRKRQRRDKNGQKQEMQPSSRQTNFAHNSSQHKSSSNNNDQWRDPASVESPHREDDRNNYHRTNHTPVRETQRHESPTSNNPSQQNATASSASFVLPDSSVPGEQERIQTSDWYMREGKRMKHEGDGMVDSRSGRTRPGEAMNRALAYFEASLFFIMSGSVMETENREDRLEINSNSSTHSPNNMYQQTLPLLDFVLKMRPHVEQDDRIFKRIMISCLRCQAVLYLRIFKLRKDVAVKYSEMLTDQFKSMNKSNRTPSPWHHANSAPNVVSPMSPAVPSPFGHHGPSPVSSNVEQVSSSTQAGKMTPPTHGGYSFPQKTFDIYRQHHSIMCNLLQAHEKWDQSENMLEEHVDFFRNIDTLCNRTMTFHSSLRDVFLYHKMVLHQLRTLTTTDSPRE